MKSRWSNQGWERTPWCARCATDHALASMGVAEQCCGRSMAYPGLLNLWLSWAALPDHCTAILGVVAMIMSCCVKYGLWVVHSC